MYFNAWMNVELEIFVVKQLRQFLFLHLDPPVPNLNTFFNREDKMGGEPLEEENWKILEGINYCEKTILKVWNQDHIWST